MKFITKNSSYCTIHISYKEMYLEEAINKKLLGLQIDNHLSWKTRTEQTTPKISRPCYPIGSMIHNSNINTLKPIYYAYFQSIIKHRIIFTLQKIIRIMVGSQPRTLHRSLFQQSKILPVPTLYILPFMNIIINNQGNFQKNSSIHNSNNTRNKHHLHRPNGKLSCFQKSTLYAGINICNILLASLTLLTNTTVSD